MPESEYLTTDETAALCGVSLTSLRSWRRVPGRGPAFVKSGRWIAYRRHVVEEWLRSHPVGAGVRRHAIDALQSCGEDRR